MKVYIAGPIDTYGKKEDNLKKIEDVVFYIENLGYETHNPANFEKMEEFKNTDYLDFLTAGIKVLVKCGILILLPHWRKSRGCNIEYIIAKALGMLILEIKKSKPKGYRLTRLC